MAVDLNQMAAQDTDFMKQAAATRQTEADKQTQTEPSFLQKWVTGPVGRVTTSMLDGAVSAADQIYATEPMKKARDATAGAMTGATNIADAAHSVWRATEQNFADAVNPNFHAGTGQPASVYDAPSPVWDHAKQHILDFRDAVAVQDPTLADGLVQGVAQLALPFAGYSRALAGLHGVAGMAAAGALTDATALQPHDMRMADLLALGRHTEGKLGDALRALAPDGSALNAYVNYLSDRGNESEAEGRFKNVLDGFGANLIATPLIHGAAMVLKQGTSALRSGLEAGVTKFSDLATPQPPAQLAAPEAAPAAPTEAALEQKPLAHAPYDQADATGGSSTGRGGMRSSYDSSPLNDMPAMDAFRKTLGAQKGRVPSLVDDGTAKSASVADLASKLATHLPDDNGEGSFYKEVLQRIAARSPDSKLFVADEFHGSSRDYNGTYSPASGFTTLFPGAFKSNGQLVHTFTHEAVHAAVFQDIERSPKTQRVLDDLRRQIADPIEEHNSTVLAQRRAGSPGSGQLKAEHYGTTNVQEFVAEAESNPRFRQVLMSTPAKDGRTVWDNYKDAIAGILGISGAVAASPLFDKLIAAPEKEKNGA